MSFSSNHSGSLKRNRPAAPISATTTKLSACDMASVAKIAPGQNGLIAGYENVSHCKTASAIRTTPSAFKAIERASFIGAILSPSHSLNKEGF